MSRYGRVYDSSSSSSSGLIVFGLVIGALLLVPIVAVCGSTGGDGESPFTLNSTEPSGPASADVGSTLASPENDGEDEAEPPPEETAVANSAGQTYVIQAGDTLWDIANRFGVTVDDLIAENDIADPASLDVGQEIVIPVDPGVGGN